MRRHELSESQWQKLKDLLPAENKPQGGRPAKDNLIIIMLNAMIYWLNTGIAWREERFGSWKTIYTRYRRWSQNGVFEDVLKHLIAHEIVDETPLMLDSTAIRVHQHGNVPKKRKKTNQ